MNDGIEKWAVCSAIGEREEITGMAFEKLEIDELFTLKLKRERNGTLWMRDITGKLHYVGHGHDRYTYFETEEAADEYIRCQQEFAVLKASYHQAQSRLFEAMRKVDRVRWPNYSKAYRSDRPSDYYGKRDFDRRGTEQVLTLINDRIDRTV